jgi:NADH-quinone oxidoreductase subunit J
MLGASDVLVAQNVGFAIIAAAMVAGAIGVVTNRNIIHAALSLVVVMGGAAAQYVLLAAEFVAVTQVLVYIGAVMVLFLFGVMLTRAKLGRDADLNNKNFGVAIPVALVMLGVMAYVLIDGYHGQKMPADAAPVPTRAVADRIFAPYLLPFWALSFLLLVAVVGAIVLARKD